MQEIWLDGSRLELQESGSWGELLEDLESKHLETGRMIRSIALDGEELSDFRSAELVDKRVEELPRVDVVSVKLEDYSRELIGGAPRHLDQVSQVLGQAVSYYRQNLPSEGAKQLHSALIGFDMILKLAASVSMVWNVEIEEVDGSTAMAQDSLHALGEALEGVVRCQESGDTTTLANVIESELIPRLAPWSVFFGDLDGRLGDSAESDLKGEPTGA